MTEFINIVSRVEWKDICGIDFQVCRHLLSKQKQKVIHMCSKSFPLVFPILLSYLLLPFWCHKERSPVISQSILQGASIFHNASGVCLMRSRYSVELSMTLNHAHLLISPCLCCQHNTVVVSFKNCSPGLSPFFAFLSHLFEKRAITKTQPDVGCVWGTILAWLRQNSTPSQLACRVRGKWFNLVRITRL